MITFLFSIYIILSSKFFSRHNKIIGMGNSILIEAYGSWWHDCHSFRHDGSGLRPEWNPLRERRVLPAQPALQMHVHRWSHWLLTGFHPETCRTPGPRAADEQCTGWPPQWPALKEASAGHHLHVRCVVIKQITGKLQICQGRCIKKGGDLSWSSKKHELVNVPESLICQEETVRIFKTMKPEKNSQLKMVYAGCAVAPSPPHSAGGVCWHCNTESLQGSSFSLEEELPGPDHRLEPVFQNLRLGPLRTRQQRQQQMWDEEGTAPVPAAAMWGEHHQERQGNKPVKLFSLRNWVFYFSNTVLRRLKKTQD